MTIQRCSVEVVRLPPNLAIQQAAALHVTFAQHYAADVSLTCDLSGVEQVDVSFVQLAASARQSFAKRGLSFRFQDAPPVVAAAFARAAIPAELREALFDGV